VLADVVLPGQTSAITARSSLRWNGEHGPAGAVPVLGPDTAEVLADVLGLGDAEIGPLVAAGVVAGPVTE
jgi:2-methylfumaryl-CoA isomerase